LGDEFSVNWMEDSDENDLHEETLLDQYKTVKRETTESHVTQYGQLNWLNEPVGEFEGNYDPDEYIDNPVDHFWRQMFKKAVKTMKLERFLP